MNEEKDNVEKTPRQIAAKKAFEKRRKAGYERWLKKMHKEKEKERKKREEEKKKAKERIEAEKLLKKKPVKMGRPKKRGRKKKHKSNYVKKKKPRRTVKWDFKIVDCRNNKQIGFVGVYQTYKDAYSKIAELMNESNEVIFPSRLIHCDTIDEGRYEYLLLEKNRDGSLENPMLRNKYGKLEEQKTTSSNWVIREKYPHEVEEDFWVWGFNNKAERKTFGWIYYNIILRGVETKYDMKRIILYKNKIIIKDDNSQIDMIICKEVSDAIRFYNLVQKWAERDKFKQIIFLGSYNQLSDKRRALETEIMELTGWCKSKVQMRSTTKHIRRKQ